MAHCRACPGGYIEWIRQPEYRECPGLPLPPEVVRVVEAARAAEIFLSTAESFDFRLFDTWKNVRTARERVRDALAALEKEQP